MPRHNLRCINSPTEAELVAPPPILITDEDRHSQAQRWLAIAMADVLTMQAWHVNFPQDIVDERDIFL
jgi:hypothetical protein